MSTITKRYAGLNLSNLQLLQVDHSASLANNGTITATVPEDVREGGGLPMVLEAVSYNSADGPGARTATRKVVNLTTYVESTGVLTLQNTNGDAVTNLRVIIGFLSPAPAVAALS